MVWVSPKVSPVTWKQINVIGVGIQEAQAKRRKVRQEGRKPIKGLWRSGLPLWATGTPTGDPVNNHVAHTSEVYH